MYIFQHSFIEQLTKGKNSHIIETKANSIHISITMIRNSFRIKAIQPNNRLKRPCPDTTGSGDANQSKLIDEN